jgi:sRNA-binding carbon storage regulator CsrA
MAMHLLVRRTDERLVIVDTAGHEIIVSILTDNRIGIETPEGVLVRKEGLVFEGKN